MQTKKIYQNKEYLVNRYFVEDKSVKDIVKECNSNIQTIYGWFTRFGIEAKRGGPGRKTLIVQCLNCFKPINRKPSTISDKNFCDYDCYHRWMIGNTAGENNVNWKGGISAFCSDDLKTKDWRSIRLEVLRRFPFCVICGDRKKKMNIHHIVPRKKISSLAYNLKNLITLCHSCHLKVKGKEIKWEAYFTRLICKEGELRESLNMEVHGNPQPSSPNAILVGETVQRLIGEDSQTNNPNTSALPERDEIVRA